MRKDIVLILGARSDIGKAVMHRFAKAGYDIELAARNADSLDKEKLDTEIRYLINVNLHNFDVLDTNSHEEFVDSLPQLPNIVICAVGYMGLQAKSEQNIVDATKVIRTNFEGPASILSVLANRFEQRGSGILVGISSVAGERGRAKNYVYGSSKAGFTVFLSGLRNRLAKSGVHVVSVLPGYVETKMTSGMDLPAKLTANPEEVANRIFTAVNKKKNIIYIKSIWQIIMIIIKIITEQIFKSLKF